MVGSDLFIPSTTAVASNLMVTALVALIPLLTFFILLGVFKVATHWCAVASLGVAILVAVVGFHMPFALSLLAASQGALFGVFPILFIVITAVWNYRLTEESGRSKDVRTVFAMVGRGDKRVQTLLIAFSFCGLMEGLAGFGAPVAISVAMLYAVGVPGIKAAVAVMVGNALNVGFGAMAIPVTTVGLLGGESPDIVAATMGRIVPLLIVWTPILLLMIVDGKRGVKEVWPAALVAGISMAGGQFIGATFLPYQLTAVFASLLSFIAIAAFTQVWKPKTPAEQASKAESKGLTVSRAVLGLLPYWLVVVILAGTKLWTVGIDIPSALSATDLKFGWPGLDGMVGTIGGEVSTATEFNLQWLSSPGTGLLLTGLIVSLVYGYTSSGGLYPYSFAKGLGALGRTIFELRLTIVSIVFIMALAYVMNLSGQTVAIGTWLARTGFMYALVAPLLGWIGTAVTGSATSAAALFASLQATAAGQAHLSPQLLLGVNEIGGGIGKIISPQNLTIAASSINQPGSEPELLRKALPYSLLLVALLGVITFLASRGILGFVIA